MKIYDFHMHLCGSLQNRTMPKSIRLFEAYKEHKHEFQKFICNGNFIFNFDLLSEIEDYKDLILHLKEDWPDVLFTALIDFRKSNFGDAIDQGVACGIKGIKFHSYEQKISESDFPDVLKVAKYAEDKKMIICVDTSYGTSKMFAYDNLKLSAYLSEFIHKMPLVLLHSGGLRILKAMLLADLQPNLFLETSFSVPYYAESTVEKDFVFAYKKIGCERVLYGSDFPTLSLERSIKDTIYFLENHKFAAKDIEKIMYGNATNLPNF